MKRRITGSHRAEGPTSEATKAHTDTIHPPLKAVSSSASSLYEASTTLRFPHSLLIRLPLIRSFYHPRFPRAFSFKWWCAVCSSLFVFWLARKLFRFLVMLPLLDWQQELLQSGDVLPLPQPHDQLPSSSSMSLPEVTGKLDAIIVLGYCIDHQLGVPTPLLLKRIIKAVNLTRDEQRSDVVVFSGGSDWRVDPNLPTEADVMAAWFKLHYFEYLNQCPLADNNRKEQTEWTSNASTNTTITTADATLSNASESSWITTTMCSPPPLPTLLLERESTSTRTNALLSLKMLANYRQEHSQPPLSHVMIVTNRFHQLRSRLVFQKAVSDLITEGSLRNNVTVYVAPFELAESREVPQFDFVRELLAIALYYVIRWI